VRLHVYNFKDTTVDTYTSCQFIVHKDKCLLKV
jgi:hypothetical protein